MIIPLDFLGLLGIVRGVTAMCGPPLGGLIFEKFEVKIFIETLVFNDIAISKDINFKVIWPKNRITYNNHLDNRRWMPRQNNAA